MRYALGLSLIGMGALLIYGGIRNESAWDIVRGAISPGAPTRQLPANPWSTTPVTNPNDGGSVSDNGRVIRTDYGNAV